jgi:hypothetical protein
VIYVIVGKSWKARNLSPSEVVKEIIETGPEESSYYIPVHSDMDFIPFGNKNLMIPDMAVINVLKKTARWEKSGEKAIEKEEFLAAIVNELKKKNNVKGGVMKEIDFRAFFVLYSNGLAIGIPKPDVFGPIIGTRPPRLFSEILKENILVCLNTQEIGSTPYLIESEEDLLTAKAAIGNQFFQFARENYFRKI